ncbi:hypothetical protein GCM10023314_28470 [Algibacter agarivorans]|uniref:Sulfatase N-terminal domain-containing protein n=1 Tax=Algibacter agarivorans TaxID=1109741 RepID=A0ABP9GTL8_9FLAO
MKLCNIKVLVFFLFVLVSKLVIAQQQPNILWIVTDDHRYDAVRAFNKMLTGNEMSELGYLESPNIDRLTTMGTTYINTYCQAQGCAPSRSSMHMGRYPFRSGIYEFEYYNNKAEHLQATLPEQMAKLGYQTLRVGKLGVRIKTLNQNGKPVGYNIYQNNIDFKKLGRDGYTAWGKDWFYELDGKKFDKVLKNLEYFVTDKGEFKYTSLELEKLRPEYSGMAKKTMKDYDMFRHYNKKKGKYIDKGMILSGVSSREAGKTRDGFYTSVLKDYMNNKEVTFTVGSQTINGIDESKPQFFYLGYDFPHTPVLPPKEYRERFQQYTYKVPEFDEEELNTMPVQLKTQRSFGSSDHFTDEEKQKMVQDYYAFCAYGDNLVGQAVDAFIEYNKAKNKPYLIVYVNGDHGWKLNDHGSVSKFTPWDIDAHNPIVIVSSDKEKFPEGKVVRDFTEFVDIAPTIFSAAGANLKDEQYAYLDGMDMALVASGKAPKRDYVIGESHAVTGPRAFIRTKDYVFSMQTRPNKTRGINMEWALNASYKDLDPGLYHMPSDPKEINNLAFNQKYQDVAKKMKEKLINIVLGDNRIEVGWGKNADGTEIYRSNFAPGAHDYKLILE